jgi:chromate transporter
MLSEKPTSPPSPGAVASSCLRVGVLGFGGAKGQLALMQDEFVDRHGWIDARQLHHALGFCTLLPGPEAQRLATSVGWIPHGVYGGVMAGLLFVLPGALVVFGLSWIYAVWGTMPLVAAVVALVIEALVKAGRRALKTPASLVIPLAACVPLNERFHARRRGRRGLCG